MRLRLPGALLLSIAVRSFAGPGEVFVREVEGQARRIFPDGEVVAACSGKLEPGGSESRAVVIFLPSNESVVAVFSRGKGRRFRVREVSRRMAKAEGRRRQELQCLGPGEVRARNKALSETETVSGEIKPKFGLGVFRHSDAGPGFSCYEYDPAKKRFVDAGGWST